MLLCEDKGEILVIKDSIRSMNDPMVVGAEEHQVVQLIRPPTRDPMHVVALAGLMAVGVPG